MTPHFPPSPLPPPPLPPFFSISPHFPPFFRTPKSRCGELVSSVAVSADALYWQGSSLWQGVRGALGGVIPWVKPETKPTFAPDPVSTMSQETEGYMWGGLWCTVPL